MLEVNEFSTMLRQLLHLSFIIFYILPVATFAVNVHYTACSQPFKCGGFHNISYPFWGDPLPSYCGIPEFKLVCQDGFPCSTVAHQSLQPWPPMHSAVIIMIHFSETGFYTIGSNPNVENNRTCNSSITVPVLQTAAKAIRDNVSSLTAVWNEGFEVQWIIDHSACSECVSSERHCGYNTNYFLPI